MSNVSKGKVTTMSDKDKGSALHAGEATHAVKLSDIHADYGWNSRAEKRVQDASDTESEGFGGFVANIHATGQLSAVILRNTNGKTLSGQKTDKPFELVCGFRRHRSIGILNAEHRHMVGIPSELASAVDKDRKEGKPNVPNLPNGTILAAIRDVGSVLEARIINGQENTARANLKAPDLVFLVRDLKDGGMTQIPIAQALGITQGWVSKLLRIASLPDAILSHWREGTPIPAFTTKDGSYGLTAAQAKEVKRELTAPDMHSLAELKTTDEEKAARYVRMVMPEPTQGDGEGAPEGNKDKVAEEVAYVAGLMGCMVRAGVLENGSLDWNRVIGPKKKGYPIDCGKDDSQERLIALGDIASDAFEKEVTKGAKGAEASKKGNATTAAS